MVITSIIGGSPIWKPSQRKKQIVIINSFCCFCCCCLFVWECQNGFLSSVVFSSSFQFFTLSQSSFVLCIDCAREQETTKKKHTHTIQYPPMSSQKTMAHRRHQHHRHSVHSNGVYNGILLGFIAFTALSTLSSGKCQSNKTHSWLTLINHYIEKKWSMASLLLNVVAAAVFFTLQIFSIFLD